jgi:gelsolin
MAEKHGAGYSGGMRKARKYDLANTNIAGLGTDLEKAVKQAAAEGEKAWKAVDSKKPGLYVWRIEQFKVVPVDQADYGSFYNGDSYIILHAYHKEGHGALMYDIHFWIGSDSS